MTTPDYILRFRDKFPTWAEPEPGAGEGLGPLAGVGMYMQYDIDRKRRDEEINHVESFIIKLVEEAEARGANRAVDIIDKWMAAHGSYNAASELARVLESARTIKP